MSSHLTRACGALVCTLGAVGAHASTIALDSEQRAAAAGLTYFRLGDEVPADLAVLTYSTKDYTERTLRFLEAAYTPAALRRARNGVTVACPVAGAFTAKLSRTNVLDIEWSACAFEISGVQHILTGPGRVELCADDFTPATISSLQIGNATRDLIERFVINGVPSGPENETRRNVRLAGVISFGRPTPDDNFDGTFSYSLNGFAHEIRTFPLATPEAELLTQESRFEAIGGRVSGELRHGDLGWKEDVRFDSGSFTQWFRTSAFADQPEEIASSRIQATGLRVLNSGDYQLGTESLLVNGGVNYTWPTNAGFGCASGGYNFKTSVTLRHPPEFMSGVDSYDAGDVLMNGTAVMKFSANADPSETGEMHVDLTVPGVGQFGYDGNSIWETGLAAAGQCAN
jgi:hypothetical protein